MTHLTIFGPTEITPDIFDRMRPAQRTEAVRMMADLGVSIRTMEEATGQGAAELRAIAEQRHSLRLGGDEKVATDAAKAAQVAAKGQDIPLNAARALLWFWAQPGNEVAVSYEGLESAAELGVSSAEYAIEWLMKRKFLTLMKERRRGRASSYGITATGRELALRLCKDKAA